MPAPPPIPPATDAVLKSGARRTVLDDPGAGEVVKVFHAPGFGRFGDGRRLRQELRAAERLVARGVRTPRPLGRTRVDGRPALRFERIAGAEPLDALLRARRPGLEPAVVDLLVALEEAGAAPPDLHPGNVVLDAEGRAWLVDVRGTSVGRGHAGWLGSVARLGGALFERHPARVRRAEALLAARLPALDRTVLAREVRAARRAANARRVRVWGRTSGATTVEANGTVRVRPGVVPVPRGWTVERHTASGAAWGTLVRAHLHRLPAARPVARAAGTIECAVPAGAVECATPPSPGLARRLRQRGLAVEGPLLVDEAGRTWIGPNARLRDAEVRG